MEIQARRCLTHPVWLGALALLVINDHVLKGAGLLPGWMTGKLSDFAGMLVAPALLAVLLRLSTRRSFALAHVAVGFVFAAINVSPPVAALVELGSSYTPFPWTITVDPTDLIALPALLLSFRVFAKSGHVAGRRGVEALAVLVGGLACAATSEPCDNGDCVGPPGVPRAPEEQASLTIGNDTDAERLVRVRRLRSEVRVNCEVLLADPTAALSRELFAPADAWLLQPGRALPLQNGSCDAYLVDAQGMDMVLLAWNAQDYPTAVLPTGTDQPSDRMIMMRMSDSGRLELDDHAAIHDAPSPEPAAPAPHCQLPDEIDGIDWTDTVQSPQRIEALASAADGCHRIETDQDVLFVCLPLSALPFAVDEQITVTQWTATGQFPESAGDTSEGTAIEIASDTTTLRAVRGNQLARPGPTNFFDEETQFNAHSEALACDLQHDSCGSAILPLSLSLLGPGVTGVVDVQAGQSVSLGVDGATLHLVRAQQMPIRDTVCTPLSLRSEFYFESVLVWQTEQL